jgi:prepilin-type N-terminal cleavage/methylation domain-containing protein
MRSAPTSPDARPGSRRRGAAFSLLELMLALAIFGMVLTAIYSTWSAILRSARVGNDVATNAQRARIAARTIEDALLSAVMFQANAPLYMVHVDTSGDFGALSLVSRLPYSFPGGGYFGDLVVRRVVFSVEAAPDGTNDLVLRQLPILQRDTEAEDSHTIVLARDVSLFQTEFLGQPCSPMASRTGEWMPEWPFTNAFPWVVRFTLAFGRNVDAQGRPRDITVRTVHIPSITVPTASSQGSAAGGQPGAGGGVPPGGGPSGPQNDGSGRFRPGGQVPGSLPRPGG